MDWALVAVVLGILGTCVGAVIFMVNLIIKPVQVVIENNTAALVKIDQMLIKHDEKIENHEGRIIKIETTHELQAKGEWNGRLT